jgi:hypothetical protein
VVDSALSAAMMGTAVCESRIPAKVPSNNFLITELTPCPDIYEQHNPASISPLIYPARQARV